jgi:hypothetical protein
MGELSLGGATWGAERSVSSGLSAAAQKRKTRTNLFWLLRTVMLPVEGHGENRVRFRIRLRLLFHAVTKGISAFVLRRRRMENNRSPLFAGAVNASASAAKNAGKLARGTLTGAAALGARRSRNWFRLRARAPDSNAMRGTVIGTLTDDTTSLFGFNDKLYILTGHEYKVWDGTTLSTVSGYVPIVTIAAAPGTGTGTQNEQVNS